MSKHLNKIAFALCLVVFGWGILAVPTALAANSTPDVGRGLAYMQSLAGVAGSDLLAIVIRVIRAGLSLVGILLVVMYLYGGLVWMTAGGDDKRVDAAKSILKNATIGVIIMLSAYPIAQFVLGGVLTATGAA